MKNVYLIIFDGKMVDTGYGNEVAGVTCDIETAHGLAKLCGEVNYRVVKKVVHEKAQMSFYKGKTNYRVKMYRDGSSSVEVLDGRYANPVPEDFFVKETFFDKGGTESRTEYVLCIVLWARTEQYAIATSRYIRNKKLEDGDWPLSSDESLAVEIALENARSTRRNKL